MQRSAILFVLAGATSGASAQYAWQLEVDDPLITPADLTKTFTLSAVFPPADWAFAGARLSIHASEAGWSDASLIDPGGTGPGTNPGSIAGPDVVGIIVGQLHFPPPIIADPTSPQPVWSGDFTITDFTVREIHFRTVTEDFRIYPDMESAFSMRQVPVESNALLFFPAPGGLAVIGLAGLALARRRR